MARVCNPKTATRREYLKRTYVFFRVVKDLEDLLKDVLGSRLGYTMPPVLKGGRRTGVRRLLYFRFWNMVVLLLF